jgi:hypothetical protein
MLRIFGYPTYAHVQSGEWSKLDSKSVQCICLCLEFSVKGYRISNLISKKNIFSKDVVFDGGYMLRKCEDEALTESHKGKQVMEVEIVYQHPFTNIYDDEESLRDSQHQEEPYSLTRGKKKCDRKALERYEFEDMVFYALTCTSGDSSFIQNDMPKQVKSL